MSASPSLRSFNELLLPIQSKLTPTSKNSANSSSGNVLSRSTSGTSISPSDINQHPQDYVIVNGQTFKVTRSPRVSIGNSFDDSEFFDAKDTIDSTVNVSTSSKSITYSNNTTQYIDEINRLKKLLEDAETTITKQSTEINFKNKKIQELEVSLLSASPAATSSSTSHRTSTSPITATGSSPVSTLLRKRLDSKSVHVVTGSVTHDISSELIHDNTGASGSSSRRTSDIYEASSSSSSSSSHHYITPTNAEITMSSKLGSFSMPTEATAYSINRHPQSPNNHSGNECTNTDTSSDIDCTNDYTPDGTKYSSGPRGLAARLSMGSHERRKMAATKRLKRLPKQPFDDIIATPLLINNNTPISSNIGGVIGTQTSSSTINSGTKLSTHNSNSNSKSAISSKCSKSITFNWKNTKSTISTSTSSPKGSATSSTDLYLFIAHDNPQLGNTVATQIASDPNGMSLMLESKDDDGITRFLLGTIAYSGDIENVQDAEVGSPRGSQFLICNNLIAIKADIKSFAIRSKGDINEINLGGLDNDCYVNISNTVKLCDYLKSCSGRVDVILDPSHADAWYPYWEGTRKMAPQFRSRGIGYLRLGDDMSRYGTAFLSVDAGVTYLDDGATSIVSPASTTDNSNYNSNNTNPSSAATKNNSNSNSVRQSVLLKSTAAVGYGEKLHFHDDEYETTSTDASSSRATTASGMTSYRTNSSRPSSSSIATNCSTRSSQEVEVSREIIHTLKDTQLKWSERAELLIRLSNDDACADVNMLSDTISVVTLSITRQKNPHVLKSALICVRSIGSTSAIYTSHSVAWKALLLEAIHLLRSSNKVVYEESINTLSSLHGKSVSLHQLTLLFEDIFCGPRGRGSGSSSNSSKVINWVEKIATIEIKHHVSRIYSNTNGSSSGNVSVSGSGCDKVDIGNGLNKCKQFILHREESTRDASVSLVACLVAYDILQNIGNSTSPSSSNSCKSLTSVIGILADNAKSATLGTCLLKYVTPNCCSWLMDVDKVTPRMCERINNTTANILIASKQHATVSTSGISSSSSSSSRNTNTNIQSPSAILKTTISSPNLLNNGLRSQISPSVLHAHRPSSSHSPKKSSFDFDSANSSSSSAAPSHVLSNQSSKSTATGIAAPTDSHSNDTLLSLQHLNNLWYEAKLTLRSVPTTATDWSLLYDTIVVDSPVFFHKLSHISKRNSIATGNLLRIVLPFDEDTSSNDQSIVSSNRAYSSSSHSNIDNNDILLLRDSAVKIRRCIRVKMSDEADLQQAVVACELLKNFCLHVDNLSVEMKTSSIHVLHTLQQNEL